MSIDLLWVMPPSTGAHGLGRNVLTHAMRSTQCIGEPYPHVNHPFPGKVCVKMIRIPDYSKENDKMMKMMKEANIWYL